MPRRKQDLLPSMQVEEEADVAPAGPRLQKQIIISTHCPLRRGIVAGKIARAQPKFLETER